MTLTLLAPQSIPSAREEDDLVLNRRQLIDLWASGILNDKAFVYLALQVERQINDGKLTLSIDIDDFALEWAATDPDTGEQGKTLKVDAIHKAIADIEKKERIQRKDRQLVLNFLD